jgi:hypothetical protein
MLIYTEGEQKQEEIDSMVMLSRILLQFHIMGIFGAHKLNMEHLCVEEESMYMSREIHTKMT